MSKKRIELTGADLAYDIMESDITIADMDCEGILTEGVRGDMQGMDGGDYGVRDDQHGDEAEDNLPMREHELGQGEVAMTKGELGEGVAGTSLGGREADSRDHLVRVAVGREHTGLERSGGQRPLPAAGSQNDLAAERQEAER